MADAEIDAVRDILASTPRLAGLAERRERLDALGSRYPLPADVLVEPVDANGVAAEWTLTPEAEASRVILFLHGGGYVSGSLDSHRQYGRASRAGGARPHVGAWLSARTRAPLPGGAERRHRRLPLPAVPRLRDAGVVARWRRLDAGLHLVQLTLGRSGGHRRKHERESRGRPADSKILSDGTRRRIPARCRSTDAAGVTD